MDYNDRFTGDDRPLDHVKGYTLGQLETAITGAFGMRNWKTIIKNKYNNNTEKYLDELFANYRF